MKPSILLMVRSLAFAAIALLFASNSAVGQSADLSAWDIAFGSVVTGTALTKTDTLTNSDTVASPPPVSG
jgi:hypothetical protein